MSVFSEVMLGILASVRGVTIMASNTSIRRLAILPFFITLVIFVVGLAWGLPFVTSFVAPTTSWILKALTIRSGSSLYSVLSWVIPVLLWPPFALFLLYMLWIITRLFASPLYSLLAERVLIASGSLKDEKFHMFTWVRVSLRMAIVSIIRTFTFAIVGFLLFVLSFIPGVGIVTSVCFMCIVTSDICDYAFEAMQWKLRRRIDFLRSHFGFVLGFSAMLAVVFLIPGLNFFLLPASVVGATDAVRKLAASDASNERIAS